jgi:hypothetical protein
VTRAVLPAVLSSKDDGERGFEIAEAEKASMQQHDEILRQGEKKEATRALGIQRRVSRNSQDVAAAHVTMEVAAAVLGAPQMIVHQTAVVVVEVAAVLSDDLTKVDLVVAAVYPSSPKPVGLEAVVEEVVEAAPLERENVNHRENTTEKLALSVARH